MKLINEETLKQILEHYPKSQHELITSQIEKMEKLITENMSKYVDDKGFQGAFDLILKKIIEGEFLQKETV
jgi:hypothetical protein